MQGKVSPSKTFPNLPMRYESNTSDKRIETARANLLMEKIALILGALLVVAILAWMLNISRYGIDFSDESFYLIWIADPSKYKASAFLFGFVYHPLNQLVGGDISLLRQSNILLTFGLAWILGACFFRTVFKGAIASPGSLRGLTLPIAGLAAIAAPSSLIFLSVYWLPTPNYNTLSLQALLLAAIGLLLAEKRASRMSVLGWLLLGAAGWLAFMAKPTTAAALVLLSCFYLAFARKFNLRMLVASALTATLLLLVSALTIDGSIQAFTERLVDGIEAAEKLGAGHTLKQMLRLDSFHLRAKDQLLIGLLAIAIFSSTYLLFRKDLRIKFIAIAIPAAFSATSLAIITGWVNFDTSPDPFQALLIFAIPLATMSLAIIRIVARTLILKRENLALALAFGLFPFAFAFGTGSNYWASASSAGIFWVFCGFTVLATTNCAEKLAWTIFLPATAGVQLITVVLLYVGMHNPYRQSQPLHQNNHRTAVGAANSKLMLSQDFADYLKQARKTATDKGFQPGDPMIDLTGHYPGTLYALGATTLGQVWAAGGYKGSDSFASTALDREACAKISAAWVLTEPFGPRTLSPAIMTSHGINLQRDYEIAGVFNSPTGAYPTSYVQHLLKPSRPAAAAIAACKQARGLAP